MLTRISENLTLDLNHVAGIREFIPDEDELEIMEDMKFFIVSFNTPSFALIISEAEADALRKMLAHLDDAKYEQAIKYDSHRPCFK